MNVTIGAPIEVAVAIGPDNTIDVAVGVTGPITVGVNESEPITVQVSEGGSVSVDISGLPDFASKENTGVAATLVAAHEEASHLPGSGSGGGAIIPRTESEVTALLASLPAGSFVLSAVVNADPAELNPPTNESVSIDEGAAISNLNVNLTLYAIDDTGVTQMMVSNAVDFSGASWETYGTTKVWVLAAGSDGARTVYAKFRDASLNESASASDTTTYTAPVNQAPGAPVISLLSIGDTTATIQVDTAATDSEDGTVNLYDVFVDAGEHASDQTITQGNSYQLTGLTNDQQIAITLKAQDSQGLLSVASNSVNATPTVPADAVPVFDSQPTEDSKTDTTITLAYATSDAEGDHYLLESSTDDGATWQTEVADEIPGAGKTVLINTLSVDGSSPLVASTAYTCKLRLTALTGNTTPVISSNVVVTTNAIGTTAVTWNPADKHADFTLSNGNRDAARASGTVWRGLRANVSKSADLCYCEFEPLSANSAGAGIANASANLASFIGSDIHGWMITFTNGDLYNNGSTTGFNIGPVVVGNRMAMCWKQSTGELFISNNGVIDPDLDTPAATGVTGTMFPAGGGYKGGEGVRIHGDSAQWALTPPAGAVSFGGL